MHFVFPLRQTTHRNGFLRREKLVRARTRPGVFATNVPFSLQVSHDCLCSFHIYDVLSLYFITHSSARSRGFQLLLPLSQLHHPIDRSSDQWLVTEVSSLVVLLERSSRTRLAVFARGRVFPGPKSHCGAWFGACGECSCEFNAFRSPFAPKPRAAMAFGAGENSSAREHGLACSRQQVSFLCR